MINTQINESTLYELLNLFVQENEIEKVSNKNLERDCQYSADYNIYNEKEKDMKLFHKYMLDYYKINQYKSNDLSTSIEEDKDILSEEPKMMCYHDVREKQ